VERNLRPAAGVDAGALVSDFLRARAPLLAPRPAAREAGEAAAEAAAAAQEPPAPGGPAWQLLGPMLSLSWDPSRALAAVAGRGGEAGAEALRRGRGALAALAKPRHPSRPRSMRDPGRRIAIVTTASLPWMTGTSVNPLLRAAYLARDGSRSVTLLLPWLAPTDQLAVHPGRTFASPAEQGEYVRAWVADRVGFAPDIKLTFYPGRWAPDKCSILPVGDLTTYVPDGEADVAVLEEPEHLTWYHHGVRWTDKFAHVVGVVHTNYLEYARREENGGVKEAVLRFVNSWVCRAYCHKVLKLSDAVQPLPRQTTCFVHGVSPRFLGIGAERAARAAAAAAPPPPPSPHAPGAALAAEPPAASAAPEDLGVYFIGKVVWGKGYTELLDMVASYQARAAAAAAAPALQPPPPLTVDVYGGGDDLAAVRAAAAARGLPLSFKGPRDHADVSLHPYRVFVNPSLSDVVATTTAEALAMGKWVVVAEHPSNAFFASRFRNCLTYSTPDGFAEQLARALAEPPAPLSQEERDALSWEAATERFMDAAEADEEGRRARPAAHLLGGVADWAAAQLHQTLTGVEPLRGLAGAGPMTLHAPESLEDWRPCRWEGGPLDRRR